MNTGRPPTFSLAYIDCGFPQQDTEKDKEGRFGAACTLFRPAFHVYVFSPRRSTEVEIWQCRFAAECVADVAARTLTAEAPTYATIMELDRKVREFPLPEGMSNSLHDLGASFQRCVLDHIRETGALSLEMKPTLVDVPLGHDSAHIHPPQLLRTGYHRAPY